MNKTRLKREVVAQVRNEIVKILTGSDGLTINEISSKLSITMSSSFVHGVVGMMFGLAIIYKSGEARRGTTVAAKYSLGAQGEFVKLADRSTKVVVKKEPRMKSLDRHVVYTPAKRTRKIKPETPLPKGSWLQALGMPNVEQ